ncbi:Clp protease N-terminal domain-containing protein [Herbidospora yilanensis]|uniref:Clp protease N-terminal domain-containing protein n=1 Tax=Herbidospora yilanensis TaxID=354426 RepID=UPI000A07BA02|nr:Clp protease N-terminal domain-containing protein [Herbidospora yilanensis]
MFPRGVLRGPVERFLTTNAERVLALADQAAVAAHAPQVAPEHLMAALLKNGNGVAVLCLHKLGAGPQDLAHPPRADDPPTATGITAVLEQARRQAHLLGHRYIGTEHLLLGLAEEAAGGAADLLARLGADPAAFRRQVVDVLREPVPVGWVWP